MSEYEPYLSQLRAQLRVGPRRTEEILQEVRAHLEARVLQFEREGLSHEEAVAKATQTFGAPREMARLLVRANSQYRLQAALKSALLGALVAALIWFLEAMIPALANGTWSAGVVSGHQFLFVAALGAPFGAAYGLAAGPGRVRLPWLLASSFPLPAWMWWVRIHMWLRGGATLARAVREELTGGSFLFTLAWIAMVTAIWWAVRRWTGPRGPVVAAEAGDTGGAALP